MQRVNDNGVQCHDNGQLQNELEASAVGTEILLLVEFLDLLLHLLHRGLIVSVLVLCTDRHFLGTKLCLSDGVLLLLDCKREHQNFDDDCKYADTDDIASKSDGVGQEVEEATDTGQNAVDYTAGRLQINGDLERIDQGEQVGFVQSGIIKGDFVFILCTFVCFANDLDCSSRGIGSAVLVGICVRILEVGIQHIVAAVCSNEELTGIQARRIGCSEHLCNGIELRVSQGRRLCSLSNLRFCRFDAFCLDFACGQFCAASATAAASGQDCCKQEH